MLYRMYFMLLVNCLFFFLFEEVVLLGDGIGFVIDEVFKFLVKMLFLRFWFGKRFFCLLEKWCVIVICLVIFKLGVMFFCNFLFLLWLLFFVEDFLGCFVFLVVDIFFFVFWLFDLLGLMLLFKMYLIFFVSFLLDMVNLFVFCFVEYFFVFEILWNILRVWSFVWDVEEVEVIEVFLGNFLLKCFFIFFFILGIFWFNVLLLIFFCNGDVCLLVFFVMG